MRLDDSILTSIQVIFVTIMGIRFSVINRKYPSPLHFVQCKSSSLAILDDSIA